MNRRQFNTNLVLALPAIAWQPQQTGAQVRVNGQRLNEHLTSLAQFGKTPEGGTNRVAYSDADLEARQYAMRLMREAKLEVSIEQAGSDVAGGDHLAAAA
ncbi:MAG: hypothetical protein ABI882_18465, partial [Acidobacteriota bacterium]